MEDFGETGLPDHLSALCDLIEREDPLLFALVPGTYQRDRVLKDGASLLERFPDPADRPPLFGLTLGVKDIFRVNGLPTQCGSDLPARLFEGPEASCVTRLVRAGAVIMGKTETTEFAAFEPGPTRNPHNLAHTPGGSSSGSAAGVARGFFHCALGTQTVGSVIRPAAFCGVVGFKPSYGRIPMDGVVPLAPSLDHAGFFCRDVSALGPISRVLLRHWSPREQTPRARDTILGIPGRAYLSQASDREIGIFRDRVDILRKTGLSVIECDFLSNIEAINELNTRIMDAESARVHREWFFEYRHLYRPRTVHGIEKGQKIGDRRLERMLSQKEAEQAVLREKTAALGVDYWIAPSAPDRAPRGIESTGDPVMNLPWTFAGLPTVSIPTVFDDAGLPHGLQVVGRFNEDEDLVFFSRIIQEALRRGKIY